MKFRIHIIIILCFYVGNLLAQSPVFRHYTNNDGLPSSEVYFITQDKKGYIWFATDMGVSRFDGYHFKNFDIQSGLPSNTIFEIFEDYKGRIWFSSFTGEISYFFNDSIIQYPYNDKLLSHFTESPLVIKGSFFVDNDDKITIGFFNQGLFEAHPDGKIVKKYPGNSYDVLHLIVDNKNEKSYVLTYYQSISEKKSESNFPFLGILKDNELLKQYNSDIVIPEMGARSCLVKDNNGNYIYAYGRYVYEFSNSALIAKRKIEDRIFSLSKDKYNNLFVGLKNKGVYVFENMDISKPQKIHYLKDNAISDVFLDNEGGYWFATLDDGVFYLSSAFYKTYSISNGLANISTECLVIDKDKDIWVGTNDNYINLICSDSICKIQISPDKNVVIKAVCIENNTLWIGTSKFLYYLPILYEQKKVFLKTGRINIQKIQNYSSTKEIIKSKNDGIWIGGSRTLRKILNKKIIFFGERENNYKIRTEAIFELPNSDLLLGTLQGLYKFVITDKNNIKGDFIYLGEKNELLKNRILDIVFSDYNNKFCLATKGAGILIYNEDTVMQITTANGLTSNSVTSLFCFNNVIWAGTNLGLNQITLTNKELLSYNIKTITAQNGLVSNEVRDIQVSDSMIYVATKSGLIMFENKEYREEIIFPPVYITNVSIKGKDTIVTDVYDLPYNRNSINIDYFGISYRNKGKLIYKHKLIGLDDNWITNTKTQAQYPYLPPGNYIFKVIAKSIDGNWSLNPAEITINISKPYWKTTLFLLAIMLTLSIITWVITYYIIKGKEKRNNLLKKALTYQQLALSNQMDPHFLSNILNSIQKFIMDNEKILSSKYLSKFSVLMRKILNASKENVISLKNEIELLELYLDFERLRLKNKFNYEFIIDEKIDTEIVSIPIFLIQPLLENSIWHGFTHKEDNCSLSLNIKLVNDMIICEIQDNGIGRAKSKEYRREFRRDHKSTGIINIKKRLEILSQLENKEVNLKIQDLKDENGVEIGTKVTLFLPYKIKKLI